MLPKLKETTRLIFLPRKKPLDFVNMLPYGKIDRIYDPRDWKQAGKVICLGEIRMAKHDALSGVKREKIREGIKLAARDVLSRPIEIYKYYLESRECYQLDRQCIKKETTNKPRKSQTETPETRTKNRHQSLKEFGVIALHAVKAEIELLPKAERPTIEPFELSNGRLKLAV
ncbi:MAG TPA: hypothetical protein DD400_03460 [Rhodospirillaceae bacterium]|nr:hypothetical protein [Rhodospirillaceae bacterium]